MMDLAFYTGGPVFDYTIRSCPNCGAPGQVHRCDYCRELLPTIDKAEASVTIEELVRCMTLAPTITTRYLTNS